MRAAENRRWILRATNNGITAVVDPAGQVREQLPGFDARSARVAFGFVDEKTPFTLYGDWFILFGALAVVAALVASQWPHSKKPRAVLPSASESPR
jgi:apolipoprotein N-acyltransferase